MRCRYLITRGAVQKLGLRDLAGIAANRQLFLAECNSVFKRAQAILIRDILALEQQSGSLSEGDSNTAAKPSEISLWIRILEAFYDSLIWIASGNDRSNVSKIYKGPKYGRLGDQNIRSVTDLAREYNSDPHMFAIPLDFARFSCVCDLMLLECTVGRERGSFIEVKEGVANEAFYEAREANSQDAYLSFFEQYGDKGIKQALRCFRQEKVLLEKTETFGAAPGVYRGDNEVRCLVQPRTQYEYYTAEIETLFQKARRGEYAVQIVDHCLAVTAVDMSSRERAGLGEFDARLFAYQEFINAGAMNKLDTTALVRELRNIEMTDWLDGLGSIFLQPPPLRPLRARSLLDLVFGRIRLRFYLHPPRFVAMCRAQGLKVGFLSRRRTNKLKSTGQLSGYPVFDGRALGYLAGPGAFVMGSSKIHEMLFNWVRPASIILELGEVEGLLREIGGPSPSESGEPLFSDGDLEPV